MSDDLGRERRRENPVLFALLGRKKWERILSLSREAS